MIHNAIAGGGSGTGMVVTRDTGYPLGAAPLDTVQTRACPEDGGGQSTGRGRRRSVQNGLTTIQEPVPIIYEGAKNASKALQSLFTAPLMVRFRCRCRRSAWVLQHQFA